MDGAEDCEEDGCSAQCDDRSHLAPRNNGATKSAGLQIVPEKEIQQGIIKRGKKSELKKSCCS